LVPMLWNSAPPSSPTPPKTPQGLRAPHRSSPAVFCLVLRPYSPEQKLPRLPIHGTAELARRSTSRCLQPIKSTLGESLIIPGHFPGQSRPSLSRIPAIPAAGRAQGPNCRR
jgi:hypothetical protein